VKLIRDIVGVRAHPAVVRLDDLEQAWISESYLLTAEVARYLEILRKLFSSVEQRGAGTFLVGHYGSGKSHFLGFVAQQIRAGRFGRELSSIVLSLLNYPASMRLEDVVCRAAGIEARDEDRRIAWAKLVASHRRGLVLLIDELSEFLRSKPDRQSFNEDVRFLQFLGEFAQGSRLFVVCAMQEQIEHTGELEVSLYRKIKDRYRLVFQLGAAHVKELIAGSILVKQPGYDAAVAELVRDLSQAFEGLADAEALASIYPLHPATLELLEEVRGQFSQSRGIVDFAMVQLGGSTARGIPPFIDRPLGDLLAPDAIVDHFRDLFELSPEFVALGERVLPYYERQIASLFETDAQRMLARRLLNLLILVHLSPRRSELGAEEAARWLLFKGSRIAPAKNVEVVRRILDAFAERGRYVKQQRGRYSLDIAGERRENLELMIGRELAELGQVGPAAIVEALALLPDGAFQPLALPEGSWLERRVSWHFHERAVSIWIGDEPPPPRSAPAIVIRTAWGPRAAAPGFDTLIPEPVEVGQEVLELLALKRISERPLNKTLRQSLERRMSERRALLERQLRSAYRAARIQASTGGELAPPPLETGLHAWLDGLARVALRRTYPSFERFAPTHGPLPQQAHARAMAFFGQNDPGAPADELVELVREAYLVPLNVLVRDGRSYAVAKRLERHELVEMVLALAARHPSPKAIYDQLSAPVYGLVADQIQALLGFLVTQGAIDILKGSRSYRDTFETLSSPLKYDRVALGRALSLEQLLSVERFADSIGLKKPGDWTVFTQRRVAAELRRKLRVVHDDLARMRAAELELGNELAQRVDRALERIGVLLAGDDELSALSRLASDPTALAELGRDVVELRALPGRIRQLEREVSRLVHLARHPDLAEIEVAAELRALPAPPSLGEPAAVERWIEQARALHGQFASAYRMLHDGFWAERDNDPAFAFRPHPLAASRHLGIGDLLAQLDAARAEAGRLRCQRLSDLDYEARCRCGFDGRTAPIDRALAKFAEIARRIDHSLAAFFSDETVRSRLSSWEEQDATTASYLARALPLPGITDVATFDRHLSGIASVKELELAPLIRLLTEKTWTLEELFGALEQLLASQDARRLRFRRPEQIESHELAAWCIEQSLRHAAPLPRALSRLPHGAVPIRPEWVSRDALESVTRLALPAAVVEDLCRSIIDGTIALPDPARADSPLIRAAVDLSAPSKPSTIEEYAAQMRDLARAHASMLRVAGERWLVHLDRRSCAESPEAIPELADALAANRDAQWIVVDALGVLAVEAIDGLLPDFSLQAKSYALAPRATTTDAFNRLLLEARIEHPFEKMDVLDRLLHDRQLPLDDLVRIARAELGATLSRLRGRIDRSRPLLLFADHGFRLARDGRRWLHGGASALERIVPLFRFV
jgi:hypothetical protein